PPIPCSVTSITSRRRPGARSARRDRSGLSRSPIRSSISTGLTRSAAPARQWRNVANCSAATRKPSRGPARMASFWTGYALPTAIIIGEILAIIVPLLLLVAYYTYAERKVLAYSQLRKGPNVVGPFGLLQPIADGLKLHMKETVIPSGANQMVFVAAPILTFSLSLIAWAVIPFDFGVVLANINVGILYLFAISSLGVYGIVMAGWASNSRYAFLGALRSAAQMVSYEVSIGFVIITVLLCAGSLNLTEIVKTQETGLGTMLGLPNSFLDWYFIPLFPMFIVFFVSALAET